MKNLLVWGLLLQCLVIISCKTPAGNHEHAAAEETHADDSLKNKVWLSETQIKTIGLEWGEIESKQLTQSLKANGVLKVPNNYKASVHSVYTGVVQSLLVQAGNQVKKGQVLATISNPAFIEVQEEFVSTEPRLLMAEQELERQKALQAGQAGSGKNLQIARAEVTALGGKLAALRQQLSLMGIDPNQLRKGKFVSTLSVRSPINGVVSAVLVKMASYVDASTSIAEIVDNSSLHLDLYVYEKDLPQLSNHQTIHFSLINRPGREYDAEIFSLGSSFEGESKAVTVHARVMGDKTGLIDGMGIRAAISLNKATVPAVPSDAIVNLQGLDYIFAVADTAHAKPEGETEAGRWFEAIPVIKGSTDIGYSEVGLLKPLPPTTKIVRKGAFFVMAAMQDTGDHDH